MKKVFLGIFLVLILFGSKAVYAGNPERVGQAGATQLLINPFARSTGMGGVNVATCYGIESVMLNPAGVVHTPRTEVIFAHTRWLGGSGIGINALGLSQNLKSGGALGFYVSAFDVGEIPITTIDKPDGGIGTFSPSYINMGLSYAKEMVSERIYVGLTVKLVSESITNASASGVAVDAGVQYRNRDGKFRLGVALRNIGPQMQVSGDGLATRTNLGGTGATFDNAVRTYASPYEMPSALLIGASYNMTLGTPDSNGVADHTLIPMFTFTAHSFQYDQIGFGIEYSFRSMFMARLAYQFEEKIFSSTDAMNAHSGLSAGATFEIPFTKKKEGKARSTFGVDYSVRLTYTFTPTHSIGIRFNL